jgi:hypothetical protein
VADLFLAYRIIRVPLSYKGSLYVLSLSLSLSTLCVVGAARPFSADLVGEEEWGGGGGGPKKNAKKRRASSLFLYWNDHDSDSDQSKNAGKMFSIGYNIYTVGYLSNS